MTSVYKTVVLLQEGHPSSKKSECWYAGNGDVTGALYVLQLQLPPQVPKIQNGFSCSYWITKVIME